MSKKILGLDLGTNSIGWALVDYDFDKKEGSILGMGSRIIPMSQDILGEFGKGNSISQTAERTRMRSARRLRERFLLRRERLHRVLNTLGFLPSHYAVAIDFEKRLGKFKNDTEPKIAYRPRLLNGNSSKYEFIFKSSFEEMIADFQQKNPTALIGETGQARLLPYDWTIYYLRKKALTQKIQKEELAWILLHFNQKRGYYQLRGEEEEENANKRVEFVSLMVVDVIADEKEKGKADTWYSIILENGWTYRRASKNPLFDWKGKVRDFIVSTDLSDDGTEKTDKEGKIKRSFRAPGPDDWTLLKKKTEHQIDVSGKTVGAFIYDTLLLNPTVKIKGKLVRTIERKFHKDELKLILQKQHEFHPELSDEDLLNSCIAELYRNNEHHREALSAKDFVHLLLNDIIFYQRPLRSQKSSISSCPLEVRKYKDKDGQLLISPLKAAAKSNPYYQEFRIWQWISNLAIYTKDNDTSVTAEYLSSKYDIQKLFEFLNHRKDIDQKTLLKYLLEQKGLKGKALSQKADELRWNYVENKTYPCNETKALISSRLAKVDRTGDAPLTFEAEYQLWHIIYSVSDKLEYEKAIRSFARRHELPEHSFFAAFVKAPPFDSAYGSFSEKAIKKLLPLMRLGNLWNWEAIDNNTQNRIRKLITGEFDESIKDRIRDKSIHLTQETDFQGLQLWLAQYIVYGKHSEASNATKWQSAADLEEYLQTFKQHSLRNPIVEQVVTETLRVVKDIWSHYGGGSKDFFSEIHIELGREMKNSADDRKFMAEKMAENENTNLRIKALLKEMTGYPEVENVRPYSPMQQEILKIYEEGVLNSNIEVDEDIFKIAKTAQPSSSDLRKYKLWLEQKYRSPYTGEIIPLNKLFTPEYEIEHIIPQSLYFDDSLTNKVICEAAVNKLKDNQIGLAFIKNHHGEKLETGFGKSVKIFEVAAYEEFVKSHYSKNAGKRKRLLMEEIPEEMIQRQLNDTRYISKFISSLLSNIVRADSNDDGVNSKNLIPGNGKITAELKQDWGLNDVWNDLILPRFKRLNELTNSSHFTTWNENHQKFLPTVPIELSKGFSKKRIDHRHHAMDALVLACATRDHINLLNNKHAKSRERFDLNRKLRTFEKVAYTHPQTKQAVTREVPKEFMKPWPNFTVDAKNALEQVVVSFKQNLRVINKATNTYQKWKLVDGVKKKASIQQSGTNWAIRKSLHKDTVSGKVHLPWVKVPKGKLLTATRKPLDTSFDEKAIGAITDTGIQKILRNYLSSKQNNPEAAFSPEGIEDLNNNIALYNDGKPHKPILKVRVFEMGSKFQLGHTGNKSAKYVEADKGTNLFFAIYADENGKRTFESIPLNVVIERMKQGLSPVSPENDKSHSLLFHLSPNDLVYVLDADERLNALSDLRRNFNRSQRIYKVVSFSGPQIFFVRHDIASAIVNKGEFSTLNKMERAIDGTMIKEYCIKLSIDRLGRLFIARK